MALLLAKQNLKRETSSPLDLNPHFTSSASQSASPQYLHLLGPVPSAFVKVYKLVSGTWSLVFAGALTVSGPGLPIGGANAPLRFQVISQDEANLSVTNTAANALS